MPNAIYLPGAGQTITQNNVNRFLRFCKIAKVGLFLPLRKFSLLAEIHTALKSKRSTTGEIV
jgi:hypothetical protein